MSGLRSTEAQKLFLANYGVSTPPLKDGADTLIQYINSGENQNEKDQRAGTVRQVQKKYIGEWVTHRAEGRGGVHPRERVLYIIARTSWEMGRENRSAQDFKRRGYEPFDPSHFKAVLDRKHHPAVGIERLKIVSEAVRTSDIAIATELL